MVPSDAARDLEGVAGGAAHHAERAVPQPAVRGRALRVLRHGRSAASRSSGRGGSAACSSSTARWAKRSGSCTSRKHFPPASKARMETMIANLIEAYRQSINELDWMTPETQARKRSPSSRSSRRRSAIRTSGATTARWRSRPTISSATSSAPTSSSPTTRSRKLGKPVDRDEWLMTPQTVNAYYNPVKNEIVFPAAILQPPFFDVTADDAVNYGAIGAVIGHEIGHGFDDQGRRYDGDGRLRDWWTPADEAEFAKRAKLLVEQFNRYSPLPGLHVNGELTLGENIGDLGGLSIAYRAYEDLAAGPAVAGHRRPHRRSAVLHGLGAGVAREGARGLPPAARSWPIRMRGPSSARTARSATSTAFYDGVRRQAGRQAVPRARDAREDLVTTSSSDSSESAGYDLVVIGGGPAGEKAAVAAAFFGRRVALVEAAAAGPGGATVHTGTLPSKTLRESALYLAGFRRRELFQSVGTPFADRPSASDLTRRLATVRTVQTAADALELPPSWRRARGRTRVVRRPAHRAGERSRARSRVRARGHRLNAAPSAWLRLPRPRGVRQRHGPRPRSRARVARDRRRWRGRHGVRVRICHAGHRHHRDRRSAPAARLSRPGHLGRADGGDAPTGDRAHTQ